MTLRNYSTLESSIDDLNRGLDRSGLFLIALWLLALFAVFLYGVYSLRDVSQVSLFVH